MKRFLNFNFGLDEVSGPSGRDDEKGEDGGAPDGKDLFDMVCKDRFSSIDNEEEMEEDEGKKADESKGVSNSSDEDEEEEVEDPWAARTKEIKFAATDEDDGPADVAEENGPEDKAKENKVRRTAAQQGLCFGTSAEIAGMGN